MLEELQYMRLYELSYFSDVWSNAFFEVRTLCRVIDHLRPRKSMNGKPIEKRLTTFMVVGILHAPSTAPTKPHKQDL